jgi:GDP-mannose 6-dehydrogenase
MNIAIFGLGYVGCVTAACLARNKHHVIGVDVAPHKIEMILAGQSPIIEPGLAELIKAGIASQYLTATTDAATAVAQSEVLLICVGTPSKLNGDLQLGYVENVCQEIGQALKEKNEYTVVVIRSTILPGKANNKLIAILEGASGKKAGVDFGFCVNPEFLREGTAIKDFDDPPYTVISEYDERSGAQTAVLYTNLTAPLHRVPLGTAEMVKYASNAFHALKVTFANEIGNLCKAYGIDSHTVMDIFVEDDKLNLSSYYLKPGRAFGGSCLPKDLRALLYSARQADTQLPILEAILPSNELQSQRAVDMVLQTEARRVGLIGLSFKPDTDDLRESPAIELAERLIGKGLKLNIYDREVSLSRLHGSNRAFLDEAIPHISSLMQESLAVTVGNAETIVIAKPLSKAEYDELLSLLRSRHTVIDLVRLNGRTIPKFEGNYNGICW